MKNKKTEQNQFFKVKNDHSKKSFYKELTMNRKLK